MKNFKKWVTRCFHSKTMIFNAAGAALITLESTASILQPFLPVPAFATISVVLVVGNAILRTVTTKPLAEK